MKLSVNFILHAISRTHKTLQIFTARKRSLRRLCFYTCLSVILFTGGKYLGRYPPRAGAPRQVHPQAGTPPCAGTCPRQVHTLPGRYTPRQVHPNRAGTPSRQVHPPSPWAGIPRAGTLPQQGTPPGRYTAQAGTLPLSSACWEIRATSGRYSSFWNAFFS